MLLFFVICVCRDPGLVTWGSRLKMAGAFTFLILGAFLFGVVLTQVHLHLHLHLHLPVVNILHGDGSIYDPLISYDMEDHRVNRIALVSTWTRWYDIFRGPRRRPPSTT